MSGPRLELLAPHDEPVLVFRRAFLAPAALVFKAWTEPDHLRHWRAPIERPRRLVSTLTYEAAPQTEALDDVSFSDHGGTTLVTGRTTFPTFEARELYAAGGAERGLAECHEHLDELLKRLALAREGRGP